MQKGTDECGCQAWGGRAALEDAGNWATQLGVGILQLQVAAGTGQGAGTWELMKQQLQAQGQAILQQLGRAVPDHPWSYNPPVVDNTLVAPVLKGLQWVRQLFPHPFNASWQTPHCQACAALNVVLICLMSTTAPQPPADCGWSLAEGVKEGH